MLETINNWVGLISALITIATFFYFQNEKFYLLIQKIITKIFKYRYPVLLRGDFSLKTEKDIKEIEKILYEKLYMRNNYIETSKKDAYFKFKTKIYKDPYNNTRILVSFKERTFVCLIEDNIRTIKEMLNKITKETNAELIKIDIFIEFLSKNPYEGFFVKRLPFEKIKNFTVEIELNETLVEATKDKIIIHSNKIDNAFYTLEDLISFKVPLVKA
jgi:hypothetical protein